MIGIYGGTFDPIHFGHLRPALDMIQALKLDEVRFIPCHVPPHRDAPHASPDQRLAMLRLALHGEARLLIDERELNRNGPSYMVDTLLSLRAELKDMPLALMIGMDALYGFEHWHRWRELVDLCHVVVAQRPGWQAPQEGAVEAWLRTRLVSDVAALRDRPAGGVMFCPVTQLEISASRIRAMAAAGESIRYLLPDSVLEYIEAAGLYKEQE